MSQNSQATQWANPTPAGLVALAVACFCFYALLSGNVGPSALPLLGCWMIGGFVIQFVVGLLDLKSNNGTGGNTFLFFSGFFMLAGGIEMFLKFQYGLQGVTLDGRIDGWAWLALTLVLWGWTPAFFKTPLPLIMIVLLLDIALPFIALIDIGLLDKSLAFVPAWSLLLTGMIAVYFSSAIVTNTAFGKSVLPIPGPLVREALVPAE
ncbi:hypothetical protein WJT86_08510 [Microvirga sp. W0021]|uniref:GPR1/FUN34/yaaH family protein n=1 Tax=Hohaiivirga grylli TaxID=3133970 RepID=A0ABV0BK66_9HYPH